MIKYKHTNIVALDWKALSTFYVEVFGCKVASEKREYSEDWLAKGTGVKGASIEGEHLLLPGYGEGGPTLEIFTYTKTTNDPRERSASNKGFAHIAFEVDDVQVVSDKVIECGGKKVGSIVETELDWGGLTFVYLADPEGNIIELQKIIKLR